MSLLGKVTTWALGRPRTIVTVGVVLALLLIAGDPAAAGGPPGGFVEPSGGGVTGVGP